MGEPPRLLIPGPVPIDPRVMIELSKPAGPHYGDEWIRRYGEVRDMLRRLFQVKASSVYPIAGPGHIALEAIASDAMVSPAIPSARAACAGGEPHGRGGSPMFRTSHHAGVAPGL